MEVNDNSNLTIPLRNLVSLLIATALAVAGYAELNSRITETHSEKLSTVFDIWNSQLVDK